jgi:hypothetical protein
MWCCGFATTFVLATAAFFPPEGTVSAVDKQPAGLSDKVAAAIASSGQQVTIEGVAVCTIWLAKDLPVKADFKPTLNVKYPFTPGQLIGAFEVQKKSEFTDFRGQDVAAGVYTLRYAQQPVDGNHVGTSELHDFLLAIPAKTDTDPAPLKNLEELHKRSATTAGANHPAIYSLLPAEETAKAAVLEHDGDKEYWIVTVVGKSGGKPLPLKLIVIGKSEG